MNKNKDCPEGKVVNPITGRCINKEKTIAMYIFYIHILYIYVEFLRCIL